MENNRSIYILPVLRNEPLKIVFTENPCPVANQFGYIYYCKYANLDINGMDLVISCENIGYKECFLKKWRNENK